MRLSSVALEALAVNVGVNTLPNLASMNGHVRGRFDPDPYAFAVYGTHNNANAAVSQVDLFADSSSKHEHGGIPFQFVAEGGNIGCVSGRPEHAQFRHAVPSVGWGGSPSW